MLLSIAAVLVRPSLQALVSPLCGSILWTAAALWPSPQGYDPPLEEATSEIGPATQAARASWFAPVFSTAVALGLASRSAPRTDRRR